MLIKHLFYTLHIYLAALTVWMIRAQEKNSSENNQCAKNNEQCDPRNLLPCCDDNFTCKLKESRGGFVCGEKVTLGHSCQNNDDCRNINHATCSKNKICDCKPNKIWVNATYCAPALRAFCWNGEKCATDHAFCIDNECQCDESSVQQSNDQCLPKLLGSFCKTDSDCGRVKFAECSKTEICTCSLNTLTVNGTCAPILNEVCQTDADCKVDNSECFGNVCECKSMFQAIANTECKRPHLGMDCRESIDCQNFLAHSECSEEKKCACRHGHYEMNDTTCAPAFNEACIYGEICATENSTCINYKCQCKPGYVYRESKCVPKYLGTPCQTVKDCAGIEFSTCSDDHICVCELNHGGPDLLTCSPLIGGFCLEDDDCVVPNSYCLRNKCECMENHFVSSNDLCTPVILGHPCQNNADCRGIYHAICSKNKICECSSNHIRLHDTYCAPALMAFCSKGEKCATDHASCIDDECQCDENFVQHSNDQCLPKPLGSSCKSDYDCERIEFAKCSRTEICICSLNTLAVNGTSCVPILNEFCEDNADCKVDNSECFDNKCECKSLFRTIANTQCERPHLGMDCRESVDCHVFLDHSECSEEKKCACRHGHYEMNDTTCAPAFNEACEYGETCALANSTCINQKCQCKPGYVYQESECVPKYLGMPCQTEGDCQEIEFSTCSEDNICVCKVNYGGPDLFTCSLLIGADCSKDDDCLAQNSRCFREKCECTEYHSVHSNGICTLTLLGHSCRSDRDCRHINHGICSRNKICDCLSNHIWVNATYCAPALRSFCWKGEICATDHATCIDDECQCDENFIQQSNNQCIPKILDSSCETDSDCNGVKFAECSTTRICTCSSNTFAVNETSCVPILNLFCVDDDDCKVDNSRCFGNFCECKPTFQTISNTECRKPHLGMDCRESTDCHDFLDRSECSDAYKCECPLGYYAISNETCAPAFNEVCVHGEICAPENSICINHKCQCKPDYVYRGSKCVPKLLDMPCQTESDCVGIQFSTCSDDNICVCELNYGGRDLLTCSPLIGGECIEDDDCIIPNSYCLRNKCECIENYSAHSNDLCTPLSLNTLCQTLNDCEHIPNSICSRRKRCQCSENFIAISGTKCVEPLGQFCTKSKPCTIENSICINNKCQCDIGFVKQSNAECIPIRPTQVCNTNHDCPGRGQECSSRKCVCKANHIALSSIECAPVLDGYCVRDKDCYVKNSVCLSNRCQCEFDYLPNSKYECESISLGKVCSVDTDCEKIKNSRCSAENICTCGMNYFAVYEIRCLPTLSGFCLNDNDCYSDSFRCTDNQCQCKSNYTGVSVDKCVETHLVSSCTDVSECSDSWHSACSLEGKCICALNNIATKTSTCLPILNGYCWKDDQCMVMYSVCNNFRCQCKPNFIAVANNLCMPVN